MKKNYFAPEVKISIFSIQNIVTTSGVGVDGTQTTEDSFNSADDGAKRTVSYNTFKFSL